MKITEIVIEKDLPEGCDGCTIAHISDLHNAAFGEKQESLLAAVKSVSPDFIAITGDLIDKRRRGMRNALNFIVGALRIAPVYYTTGNHESASSEFAALQENLLTAGVRVLRDRAEQFDSFGMTLIGLDDPGFHKKKIPKKEGIALTAEKMKELAGEGFTVVLSHRPEYLPAYEGADLVLCGHAHGGQVRLPLIGGLYAPGQGVFPRYTSGAYRRGKTTMVVSRGLGNSRCPLRINNPPEIVAIRLKRRSENG